MSEPITYIKGPDLQFFAVTLEANNTVFAYLFKERQEAERYLAREWGKGRSVGPEVIKFIPA